MSDDPYEQADDLCKEANALFVDEQFEDARRLYSEALARAPKHIDALVKRAQCALALEEPAAALADADHALALEPAHDMALLRRGAPQFSAWLRKAKLAVAEQTPEQRAADQQVALGEGVGGQGALREEEPAHAALPA